MNSPIVVAGIGNAVLDILIESDNLFLEELGMKKGEMQLVDRDRIEYILSRLDTVKHTICPGGSVSNTISGLAQLGADTSFSSRVRDDKPGQVYVDMTTKSGTVYNGRIVCGDLDEGSSISVILITPDGERTMNTYLGVSRDIEPGDTLLSKPDVLFLEGYLLDGNNGAEVMFDAIKKAENAGSVIGLTLSDPGCVERHRETFKLLTSNHLDFIIGNDKEWAALYQTSAEDALEQASMFAGSVVCTRSSKSVLVIQNGETKEVPVHPVTVVDTTGAGDQFAAGFIYGYANRCSVEYSIQLGIQCASEVIKHIGARPWETPIEGF